MRTFDERKQSVQGYLKKAKGRKRALTALKVAANIACVLAIIIGIMHIPYGRQNVGAPPTNPFAHPTTTGPFTNEPTVDGWPTPGTVPTNWPTYPSPTIGTWPTIPPEPQNYISVQIWVSSEDMMFTISSQINQINNSGIYDKVIVPEFSVHTSDAVRLKLMELPPDIWPDIVCVDQIDLRYLAMCDALTPFYEEDQAAVTGENDVLSKKAARYEGHIYGAPLYHKDANFLYYDRSVISDQEAESLESIIAACEKAGKKFCFDLDNPYHQASFYLGAGWDSYWINDRDGRPVSYQDNLNSRVGELALQGMQTLLNSSCYITPGQDGMYSNETYEEAFKQSAAIVGGVWEYGIIVPYIENLGITKLPTFQTEDGSRQLGSFARTMMLAVPRKNGEDGSDIAVELALYLTNETNQLDNWYEFNLIPTNVSAQAEIETHNREKRDNAFIKQIPFTVPMEDFPSVWWDYLDNVPSYLANGLSVTQILQDYQRNMEEAIANYPAQWFVVGQVNGSFWNAEYRLICNWDNLLITDELLYFEEDSEFLIMYLDNKASIKEFFGQDGKSAKVNFKPGVTGYYYVVYDPATGACTLRAPQPE